MERNQYGCVIASGRIIKAQPGHFLQIVQVKLPEPALPKPELLDKGIPNRHE